MLILFQPFSKSSVSSLIPLKLVHVASTETTLPIFPLLTRTKSREKAVEYAVRMASIKIQLFFFAIIFNSFHSVVETHIGDSQRTCLPFDKAALTSVYLFAGLVMKYKASHIIISSSRVFVI